jgi:hypothetical protein
MYNAAHYSFLLLLYWTLHVGPNWPSSGVQIVMVKDSAANCNAVFWPPIVIASGYFVYVGYHQFYFGILRLHVVAFL